MSPTKASRRFVPSNGQCKRRTHAPNEREQMGLLAERALPVVEPLTADQHATPDAGEDQRSRSGKKKWNPIVP